MAAIGKYCPEIVEKIAEIIAQGNYATTACAIAGINDSTYYDWLKDESKPEFSNAIKKAEAESEARHVANIDAAGASGQWQASAWHLERKYKDRWAKTENQNVTHSGEGLEINVTFPSAKTKNES